MTRPTSCVGNCAGTLPVLAQVFRPVERSRRQDQHVNTTGRQIEPERPTRTLPRVVSIEGQNHGLETAEVFGMGIGRAAESNRQRQPSRDTRRRIERSLNDDQGVPRPFRLGDRPAVE